MDRFGVQVASAAQRFVRRRVLVLFFWPIWRGPKKHQTYLVFVGCWHLKTFENHVFGVKTLFLAFFGA